MATLIPLTMGNLVPGTTNSYRYDFNSVIDYRGREMCLSTASMFRSWDNVNGKLYGNSSFSYTWIDGTVVPVVMPDGIYTVDDISGYMQGVMRVNKHYLLDNSPTPAEQFYMSLETNGVYYRVQLNAKLLPAVLPVGWSYPAGAAWVTSAKCPQITIVSKGFDSDSFGSLIGFNSYPLLPLLNTAAATILGDFAPTLEPVQTIYFLLNCISAPQSIIPQAIYAINATGYSSSAAIDIKPPAFLWVDIANSMIQSLTLTLVDQKSRPLQQKDPNAAFVFAHKPKQLIMG